MAKDDDEIANLEKQVDEVTTKLEEAITAKSTSDEEIAKLKKSVEELTAKLATEKAEKDMAVLKAKATQDEKDCEDTMPDEELPWDKKPTKKGFWSLTVEKRATVVAEFVKKRDLEKKNDESVEIDGQTLFKSKIGPELFAVMKSQAAQIKKQADDLKIEKERRETAELTKQADDGDMKSFAGTTEDKVELLRSLQSMPEKVRATLDKMLKAGGKALEAGFETVGHKNEKAAKSAQDFEAKIAEIRKRENCTRQDAMSKARKEFPEAFKAYQESGAQ